MFRWRNIFTLLLTLLTALSPRAQQYNFIHYSVEDGLAQSQVRSICQDDDGYLWLSTLGGLSRFDGRQFINFSTNDGLIDNQVNVLQKDKNGNLWMGSLGGVTRFNGTEFQNFMLPESATSHHVVDLSLDTAGNLWLATDGAGAYQMKNDTFISFSEDNGLISDNIRSILCDQNGNVWFGTPNGLSKMSGGKVTELQFHQNELSISDITQSGNGKLWFSTYGNGVFIHDIKSGKTENLTYKDGLINDYIRHVHEDEQGNIWLSSKTGLCKYDGSGFTYFTSRNGLPHENIKVTYQDLEGNIWLGTDGGGLLKFPGEAFVTFTQNDGLGSNFVMSVSEDRQGNLWFSTYGSGISKFDGEKFNNYTWEDGLANNTVWTSLVAKNGNLWFGTSGGLSRFDGSQFITYTKKDGLLDNKITAIFEDQAGKLWLGTGDGLSVFDGRKFTNYPGSSEFNAEKVRSIQPDQKGHLWFGTTNGIVRYNGSSFKNFTMEDGLSDNTVYSIVVDGQYNLWIGTKNGLTFYNGKEFRPIKIGTNYSANHINFLVMDERQNLWIGTNNGIYQLNTSQYIKTGKEQFKHYSTQEGIPSAECNLNAAFKDSDGNFWFGTTGGVVNYNPHHLRTDSHQLPPFINITDIKLFLEETDWKKYSDSINDRSGLPMNLSVRFDKNYFTFYYTGISHTNPQNVRYRFMLEGFDQGWSPETEAPFATYSNLPYGEYTFKVKAGTEYGSWNSKPATFSFEIRPPFWVQWWFFLLCALGIGLIAAGIVRWRLAVAERKRATRQLEYKSKMLSLEQQTLNASLNRHFIFNALNSIQYYINKQDKLAANKYLTSFARLIRKNLDSSGEEGNAVSLAEELDRLKLYLSLEHMRFSNKFTYDIHIDDDVNLEKVTVPSMLLQPFVENSIWHGILPSEKSGHIDLRIKKMGEDRLQFIIEDNGIGVDASKGRKNGQAHISRGIEITSNRVELLKQMTAQDVYIKGPIQLNDENGNVSGTRVEIVLPVKQIVLNE